MSKKEKNISFSISGHEIEPGTSKKIEIHVSRLPSQMMVSIPAFIIHGSKPGPCMSLSGAVHGDELNGIEIVQQIINQVNPKKLSGTILAVPIVNIFGVLTGSRYLPDRRDLNRSFPGSKKGSLASRLAHIFLTEIISKATYAIDFHTAGTGRTNLPQIRANLEDQNTYDAAIAFAPPVILHSKTRDGSLRQAAVDKGCHMLLYEAGEPNRFDKVCIDRAVKGVYNVMTLLKMISKRKLKNNTPICAKKSQWIRASRSGIFRPTIELGSPVKSKQLIGTITDYFGEEVAKVKSSVMGIVIGLSTDPIVNQGDAVVNVATTEEKLPLVNTL